MRLCGEATELRITLYQVQNTLIAFMARATLSIMCVGKVLL